MVYKYSTPLHFLPSLLLNRTYLELMTLANGIYLSKKQLQRLTYDKDLYVYVFNIFSPNKMKVEQKGWAERLGGRLPFPCLLCRSQRQALKHAKEWEISKEKMAGKEDTMTGGIAGTLKLCPPLLLHRIMTVYQEKTWCRLTQWPCAASGMARLGTCTVLQG